MSRPKRLLRYVKPPNDLQWSVHLVSDKGTSNSTLNCTYVQSAQKSIQWCTEPVLWPAVDPFTIPLRLCEDFHGWTSFQLHLWKISLLQTQQCTRHHHQLTHWGFSQHCCGAWAPNTQGNNCNTRLWTPKVGRVWMCMHNDSGGTSTSVHSLEGSSNPYAPSNCKSTTESVYRTHKREERHSYKRGLLKWNMFFYATRVLCSGWEGSNSNCHAQSTSLPPTAKLYPKDYELDLMLAVLLPAEIIHLQILLHNQQCLQNSCSQWRLTWLGCKGGQNS